MKVLFTILAVVVFSLGLTIQACSQGNPQMKIFQNPQYLVQYPADWAVTSEKGIVNIYPKNQDGAITISFFSDITFPLDETKSSIIEMNELSDSPESVKMTKLADVVEFTHNFVDAKANRHWFTKVLRKGSDLYLITINCRNEVWEKQKGSLFSVVDTFQIKP